jgi:hypothetical protein
MEDDRVIELVEQFNEQSLYNLDVYFLDEDDERFAILFDRFSSDDGFTYDKFTRTVALDEVDDVAAAIRENASDVIEHARDEGFNADQESDTSGEL